MPNEDSTAAAKAVGRMKADDILNRRQIALARREQALSIHPMPLELKVQVANKAGLLTAASQQTAGFLVALGDSWFDYPFYDVLKLLDDNHGYNVESAAHATDRIESMAYHGGQLDKFARCMEKVLARGATPKAVLVSGGGNDIAGKEFGMLLDSAVSSIAGWNDEIVDGVIHQRIAHAYVALLSFINSVCQQKVGKSLPILVHGYDYPVPDGRGVLGGWFFLPGPWLDPGFREKLFPDLATNIALMHDIVDRLNNMLAGLTTEPEFANVHIVDLRGTLSTDLGNYKDWWGNELHPSEQGFDAVTEKFASELNKL